MLFRSWKIAYDESLSPYSPGVQFILEYARHQLADDSVDATDSCAIPDHPMIDQLWRERIAIADFFVASDASSATAFGAAVEREALRRGVRAIAKRAFNATRRQVRRLRHGKAA